MKERRFKIVMVSMHVVSSWGKTFGKEMQDALPDDSIILNHNEDFDRASLCALVYHEKFPIIALGEKVPRSILDVKVNTEAPKPKLIFNH